MHLLRRYRVGLVLLGLLVAVGVLVVYRLKDQQARAVTRPRRTFWSASSRRSAAPWRSSSPSRPTSSPPSRRRSSRRSPAIFAGSTPIAATSWRPGRSWSRSTISSCRPPSDQAQAIVGSSQAGLEMARSTLEGNRANLENQRANLAKARAVADNDARQAVRMKTLFERGLVSATDWENARTNSESSQANVQSAEAQLRRRRRPDRHRREPGPALPGPARDQSGGAHARADESRQYQAASRRSPASSPSATWTRGRR